MQLQLYNIDYYGLRLNVLETFEEGEFVFAQKLKFVRKYVTDPTNATMFTHHTEIKDQTLDD